MLLTTVVARSVFDRRVMRDVSLTVIALDHFRDIFFVRPGQFLEAQPLEQGDQQYQRQDNNQQA